MNTWGCVGIGAAFLAAYVLVNVAQAGIRPDDPATLEKTRSLGQLIATATKPIHIVYVHGMNADGPGASDTFREGLCKHVARLCPTGFLPHQTTQPLPLGSRPDATFLDEPIWRDDHEWQASTPFVYRYVYTRNGAPPVVVDEVNWWPLLFPPKCRFIVLPEINLSGVDKAHLELCARTDAPFYPWISRDQLTEALAHKPISGGGAWANSLVKQNIMNWGVADAALALGPMRTYFRQAINQAFKYAAAFDGADVAGQDFVVISESLGSFVVLDAFGNVSADSPEAQSVGERTADLYFFANQYALLELGRIHGVPESWTTATGSFTQPLLEAAPAPGAASALPHLLRRWAASRPQGPLELVGRPKQVIAFSDPSDLLTYVVPKLRDSDGRDLALVVNVYDRNEWSFLRLFANPLKAHTKHAGNKDVLKLMFR